VELEFTYTPDDFQEMLKAKWPESSGKMRTGGWVLLALVIVVLVWEMHTWTEYREWKMNLWPEPGENLPFEVRLRNIVYSPFSFFLVFVVAFVGIFIRSRSRRGISLWNLNIAAQQLQRMTIDEEGIQLASPLAETRFRWPMVAYWAETANLFVLRLNTKSLLVIPKRAATVKQLEQLRKSFGERIVAPAKGFPVVMAHEAQAERKADGRGRAADE